MKKLAVILLLLSMLPATTISAPTTVQTQIAVYNCPSSEGTMIIYNLLLSEGYSVTLINEETVKAGLSGYDLVVFPGGYEHVFAYLLSCRFRYQLRSYIRNGGKYIGVCGGAAVGVWTVKGFTLLEGLRFMEAYLYTLAMGRTSFLVEWQPCNTFGKTGQQIMTWAGGPPIELDTFKTEALYAESKLLVPYKDKPAIASGYYGNGKMILFGPHPEYQLDTINLLLQAVEAIVF